MPFTQSKQANIAMCNGCSEQCKLGAQRVKNTNGNFTFYPTIASEPIITYIDANGQSQMGIIQTPFVSDVIEKARCIAQLCDKYNPKHHCI